MQEFWTTVSTHHHSLRFKLNGRSHTLNVENLRDMLHMCRRLPGQRFEDPPLGEEIRSLIRDLRHTNEIKEDLVYQVENKNSKKNNDMYYLRFTKFIIDYYMSKDQSISRRNKMFWHTARDDPMFNTIRVISRYQDSQVYDAMLLAELTNQDLLDSKAYKEYYVVASRAETPKAKIKYKKKADESVTSLKSKTASASKGTRLKSKAKVTKPALKKQPTKKTKAIGLAILSEVALSEAEQVKLVTKRSKIDFHISQASGSGDGVDTQSKGNSDDEDDDNDDDGDNNDDAESDDHDDDNDNERTESDSEEIPDPNLTKEDQIEYEEEDVDEGVCTPSDNEFTDEEKLDDEKTIDAEEDDVVLKELYEDVNVNLEKGDAEMADANPKGLEQPNVSQESGFEHEEEDAHVTLTLVSDAQKADEPVERFFVSFNFTSKFLNLENPSLADHEIASLMETSAPHATAILEITFSFTTTPPPPPMFFNPLLQQQTPTIPTPTYTNPTVTLPEIPNFASVFKFDERMKEAVNVAVQLQTNKLRKEAQAENQDFLNQVDSTMNKIIKNQVKEQVSKIMPNIEKRKRLMRTDELRKFSDGTLNDVRSALHDIVTVIRIEYLKNEEMEKLRQEKGSGHGLGDRQAALSKEVDVESGKAKRVKRHAKKYTTVPIAGVAIRDTPGVSVSKKKAPTKADRSKGIEILYDVALSEAAQLKEATKRSKKDSYISLKQVAQVKELILNQGFLMSDNEDDNDNDSKGDDDKADSDDDGNSDADDNERTDSDDDDENPSFTLKDYDEEEHDEEYKSDDDNKNVFEEEDDDLYNNVDMSHKVPGTQIPSPLTEPATVIPDSFNIASITVPPTISMISLPQLMPPSPAPTTIPTTTSIPTLPDFSSLFGFDQRITINESLKIIMLAKSSSQPKSTYEAAESLIEFELKKILLDKMEKNESYKTAPKHKELYEGLVKSYNLDKDLFSSYGNSKSSGKSVQAEEPVFETADTENPQDQGGDTKDQPNVEATPMDDWFKKPNKPPTHDRAWNYEKSIDSRPPQKWISNIAKARQPPRTFDELMRTPIDFSAYVMHNLKIDNLTQEILEPVDSLSMGDEHLDTIPATESDEVIMSSVEDLVPIPGESEGIPEHMCDVPFHDNSSPLDVSNDQIEDFSESINEVMEVVIPEVRGTDDDIPLTIKDDNLRKKLLNFNLLIATIEALNDNPTPSSDCKTKSSSTSLNSFLEETNTFHNSLPEFENFYFDLGEISSGSTTTHSDISLSEYESFIFEEFVDKLAHIISLPEYDCFYFRDLPDHGELMYVLNSGIRKNLFTTLVNLPIEDDHSLLLAYVVWIFVAYLTYPVIPSYLHPFGNEDTIFDPSITINHFYSFKPGSSHRHGAFRKFNTHRSHLNEWPMIINGKNTLLLDVLLFHFYPP
uniref:Uncharacterized protein n=1 Tax=Tanacetum cinerariifolium TaxID=118510 RepID=A0A6L2LUG1_TANCI|nr:hypothetical protein [Tanacetum cinerariifolium]